MRPWLVDVCCTTSSTCDGVEGVGRPPVGGPTGGADRALTHLIERGLVDVDARRRCRPRGR